MDGPLHKTAVIDVPVPWDDAEACASSVTAALDEASEGGRWILVGTEMMDGDRRMLAVFRRGRAPDR